MGAYGEISYRTLPDGRVEARARFRLRNGKLKPVRRRGPSKNAARNKLKKAMAELADEVAGKDINGDTRMTKVMDLWLAAFEEKVNLGKRAHKSLYDYRDIVDNHLRPAIGDLACREAENAGLMDEVLKEIRRLSAKGKRGKHGTSAMLRARSVLSGVCGYAARHGAMKVNPVKGIEQIDHEHEEIRALDAEQRADFFAKFDAWIATRVKRPGRLGKRARAWTDLPDILRAELCTGCRPGEVLAMVGDGVDLGARKVAADHHLVRIAGVGMVRQPNRKGNRPAVEPPLTEWSLPMWRRRKLESGGGPLFPSWNGQWLDPGNAAKRINEACVAIGYGWVSSRILRHTTATHIVNSGLTNEEAADALGNTPDVVEAHYRAKQKGNPKVAAALESLMGDG